MSTKIVCPTSINITRNKILIKQCSEGSNKGSLRCGRGIILGKTTCNDDPQEEARKNLVFKM
jgi:hypothetical protein